MFQEMAGVGSVIPLLYACPLNLTALIGLWKVLLSSRVLHRCVEGYLLFSD
jgi:hypothetical protein